SAHISSLTIFIIFLVKWYKSLLLGAGGGVMGTFARDSMSQYGSVKEIYPLRQAGGAGDAGEAGGEKKLI
ncbi:hypothetical protein, partial [Nostoc sp. ChiQUE01b]|uniref:hypothetical protein n=1 Tax=Nostoc sp. ChiQUE01b TaxID=3075376 RepID=UPI002AD49B9B